MGTNYYARWNPSPTGHGPATLYHEPQTYLELHICKSLNNFQGQVFNSWAAWKHFLTSNAWSVEIRDEYGVSYTVAEFVNDVEAVDPARRRRQYDWVIEHNGPNDRDWLDADGFSFYSGEFS